MTSSERWRLAVLAAVRTAGTPCYVVAAPVVLQNLNQLRSLFAGFPVKHLLSAKTQPVRPLLELWNDLDLSIDVISECELVAALDVGFSPDRIVVNGVNKHSWLKDYVLPGLSVHFDSVHEVTSLVHHARASRWSVGLRLNLPRSIEYDPDEPGFGTQFGLTVPEANEANRILESEGVAIDGIHFHLGTDLRDPKRYRSAIDWTLEQTAALGLAPRYLDIGGGLPDAENCGGQMFDLDEFRSAVQSALDGSPSIREVWMENGRFMSGTAGVLAVRVFDLKCRDGMVFAICDGGRTNNALVSDWEQEHPISVLPVRSGETVLTTVCGPTCMAFDQLGRFKLPPLNIGDLIVWGNAGAYHISWETRFSHGRCAVVWCDENWRPTVSRERELPEEWWSEWCVSPRGGMDEAG